MNGNWGGVNGAEVGKTKAKKSKVKTPRCQPGTWGTRRLKERFPTEKEQDFEWSQKDPVGHSEAHKDDGKKTK